MISLLLLIQLAQANAPAPPVDMAGTLSQSEQEVFCAKLGLTELGSGRAGGGRRCVSREGVATDELLPGWLPSSAWLADDRVRQLSLRPTEAPSSAEAGLRALLEAHGTEQLQPCAPGERVSCEGPARVLRSEGVMSGCTVRQLVWTQPVQDVVLVAEARSCFERVSLELRWERLPERP